jgi:hypothetical protein
MREFGKEITKEQVAIAQQTALQPFNEPTEIEEIPYDTVEALLASGWLPDPDPTRMRWRTEHNVSTGKVTHYELTLEQYAERHIAKAQSRNAYVLQKRAEKAKADRDALHARFLDAIEADPALLDRLIKG